MSKAALEVTDLCKSYGRTVALDRLDLKVPKGAICGFIGPNGAGKTTTFGIVGGLIRADHGNVSILGKGRLDPRAQSGVVTMLPQDCQLSPHVSIAQLLKHFAMLQGMNAADAVKAADEILDEVALRDRANNKIKQLSHGMRRRVAIAQALLGKPKLVLLDEPTSGLDPELVIRMRELFAKHRGKRTLVISSHNLLELEALCDHVVFIERGRCTKSGSLNDVTEAGVMMRYILERSVDMTQLEKLQPQLEMTFMEEGKGGATTQTLVARATAAGWSPAQMNATIVPFLFHMQAGLLEIKKGQSLEDAYLAGRAEAALADEDSDDD